MAIRERMSGNEAVAHAIKQINPDVMAAFPITPSTEIPQMVSTFIANGDIDTEFIPVESEHSSMSATMGACAAGARAITATSSCGLAYMWEVLYVAFKVFSVSAHVYATWETVQADQRIQIIAAGSRGVLDGLGH